MQGVLLMKTQMSFLRGSLAHVFACSCMWVGGGGVWLLRGGRGFVPFIDRIAKGFPGFGTGQLAFFLVVYAPPYVIDS